MARPAMSRSRQLRQRERHEDAIAVFTVGAKRPALLEARAAVQSLGRQERWMDSGFEVENAVRARTSDLDDVVQKRSAGAPSARITWSAHGLDLAFRRRQLFESGAAQQQLA